MHSLYPSAEQSKNLATSPGKKILLAFSGGLDTSAILPWLKETYQAQVIAYCADLGNSPDREGLKKKALDLGATDFIFEENLKNDFVSRFAFPAIRAGATYQDDYLLGTALGRPLIAERMAHFAKKLGASAMAHGCTGKGNDQLRFERSWAYLMPEAEIIAPWRIWNFKGRGDLLNYLKEKRLDFANLFANHFANQGPVANSLADKLDSKPFSEDVNLMHRSCEGGILEDPSQEYEPDQIFQWVKPLHRTSDESFQVNISFVQGIPTAINQKTLEPAAILSRLNEMAGLVGVGVQDLVEERANGIKSRGIYETPGGTVLHTACRALKHLCWDRSLLDTARALGVQYGENVYDGLWHSPLRQSIESFFEKASESLTGSVQVHLERGNVRIMSRQSAHSLYQSEAVTFEADSLGIHHWADGFCKTMALKQRTLGARDARMHKT